MMLDLFDFQTDAKNYLLDKTTDPNAKRKIIVKSPTGSGKTIILLSYIYDYVRTLIRFLSGLLQAREI